MRIGFALSLRSWLELGRKTKPDQAYSPLRFSIYAKELEQAISAMKIQITEPVFFFGEDRAVGDVMDVQVGPYRHVVTGGGLQRIPQFVEMPEEIKDIIQEAVGPALPTAPLPPPASFAEATAAVLKPAPVAKPVSRTAALLSALAGRRRKLEDSIGKEAADYAKQLDVIEANVPQVFSKAKTSLSDRQASLDEIDESLKDLAGSNADPLQA